MVVLLVVLGVPGDFLLMAGELEDITGLYIFLVGIILFTICEYAYNRYILIYVRRGFKEVCDNGMYNMALDDEHQNIYIK